MKLQLLRSSVEGLLQPQVRSIVNITQPEELAKRTVGLPAGAVVVLSVRTNASAGTRQTGDITMGVVLIVANHRSGSEQPMDVMAALCDTTRTALNGKALADASSLRYEGGEVAELNDSSLVWIDRYTTRAVL